MPGHAGPPPWAHPEGAQASLRTAGPRPTPRERGKPRRAEGTISGSPGPSRTQGPAPSFRSVQPQVYRLANSLTQRGRRCDASAESDAVRLDPEERPIPHRSADGHKAVPAIRPMAPKDRHRLAAADHGAL